MVRPYPQKMALSQKILLPARHRAPRLTMQESDLVALNNVVKLDHKRPPAIVGLNDRTLVTCGSAYDIMSASHEYIELSDDKDYEPKGTFLGMPIGTLTTRDIAVEHSSRVVQSRDRKLCSTVTKKKCGSSGKQVRA